MSQVLVQNSQWSEVSSAGQEGGSKDEGSRTEAPITHGAEISPGEEEVTRV